ncbi:hypothetical protein J3R30DRAFT_2069958 [Lentinula aciculospora]|uniref:F-box domain-containing protein n=1 Tax=Lentinula aciculospora TaxID=153920 RepID=A0A9W8ZUH2_9AGAR|nr:hypothetical protein J3R30DRAFT_2069958 [Lentinula aciculospora]
MDSHSILALPSNIHLDIFHAVHENGDRILTISHVCKLWRELSVNTSIFWTHIPVDISLINSEIIFDDPLTLSPSRALEVFPWPATLLHRSGFRPIDLDIIVKTRLQLPQFDDWRFPKQGLNIPWAPAHSMILSRILAPHAARFRSVVMVSNVWHPIHFLSESLFGISMPFLEEWNVALDNSILGVFIPAGNLLPENVVLQCPVDNSPSIEVNQALYPKLTYLSLGGITHGWRRLVPRNLVSLDLSNLPLRSRPTFEELKVLLLSSKLTLEVLKLSTSAPQSVQPVPDNDKITLPNVRTLKLGLSFVENDLILVTHLDVPGLESLEICDFTNRGVCFEYHTFNDLHPQNIYLEILRNWPLMQLKCLSLESPHSYTEEDSFTLLHHDFIAGRKPSVHPPVFTTLFLNCSSLKNLRIVDPDPETLMALNVALVLQDDEPGILPCGSLDVLDIKTRNHQALAQFLARMKFYSGFKSSRITRRFIPSIILDVPPDWGAFLCRRISHGICAQLLNGQEGYFMVESGRVFNLLDNLP